MTEELPFATATAGIGPSRAALEGGKYAPELEGFRNCCGEEEEEGDLKELEVVGLCWRAGCTAAAVMVDR
jgi:hypothetical protein